MFHQPREFTGYEELIMANKGKHLPDSVSRRSDKITILSFFMMLGIVWTHSRLPDWNVVPDYFHQLVLWNEIGQDTVAAFFLITAFLYFRNFSIEKYTEKLKTRFYSLIIPYLIWNTLNAVGWFVTTRLTGNQYVNDSFTFDSVWHFVADIVASKFSVLWYVGVIIVYAVASPVFYYLGRNKRVATASIIVFLIIGISFHHPFCSPIVWMSIYMMGAYLGMHHKDYMFGHQPVSVTIVALLAFPLSVWYSHMHDTMLAVNIRTWASAFFFIGIYDVFDRILHFKVHHIYKYTFFLYATHYILVHVGQRYIIVNANNVAGCWLAYVLVPPLVVVVCLSTAYVMNKHLPRLYDILTGQR